MSVVEQDTLSLQEEVKKLREKNAHLEKIMHESLDLRKFEMTQDRDMIVTYIYYEYKINLELQYPNVIKRSNQQNLIVEFQEAILQEFDVELSFDSNVVKIGSKSKGQVKKAT